MTVTQFNEELASLINKVDLPFDAKVFVIRSIHSEVENKYNEYLAIIRKANEQTETQKESEETKTEQGGN